MPTYAIGDIHGWREPLDELLAAIRSRLTREDTVVFLGDYIDRGDDSRGCIDAVLQFRDSVPARVECLIGNHEEWLLNDPDLDTDGWPWPRRVGNTIGIDAISHGVLTAVGLPGPEILQSARYERAVRVRG
jgi:hypothetical protein